MKSSTFKDWIEDLESVVDSLGLEKFALLGMSHGGALSIAYTARHPDRVSHLILYGASALGRARTQVTMADLEELNAMLTLTRVGWGTGNPAYQQLFTSLFMSDGTSEQMRWFNELQSKSTSPENAVRFIKEFVQIDVQDQLAKISVPTLVIHSRGDLVLPFQAGRELATRIPGAHFVPLNSRNHILMEDEDAWKEFLFEVRKFLGVRNEYSKKVFSKKDIEYRIGTQQLPVLSASETLPSIVPSILKEMVPSGLSYGAHYVVEFEPDSLWYETSITAAAQALKSGVKVDYHTFQHSPQKVRDDLARLGVDLEKLEQDSIFRIMDTYTAATGGFRTPSRTEKTGAGGSFWAESVKISDWSLGNIHDIRGDIPEAHKNRFHIDDNTSILFRYNDESELIDYWRTRVIPWATHLGLSIMHSVVAGVASSVFLKQLESYCEGIFDLKSLEEDGEMQHYIRVRTMRGKVHDSRWRHLRLLATGEVVIDTVRPKGRELGIGRWLKGPR